MTGGVGAGKSAVGRLLVEHGAVLIDSDVIAREVVEPGTPGFDAVVERFGAGVVVDGRLDRAALAAIVFNDAAALADLNAIVHPLVGRRAGEILAAAPAGAVVVHDIPLLVENDLAGGFDLVLVVEAPVELRLTRLRERGLAEDDARARMANQASDEQRRAVADVVIENDADLDTLRARVDAVWTRLTESGLERSPGIG